MLYVTTRNNVDPCTPQHILQENCCRSGGLYIPFRVPVFATKDLKLLERKSFGQRVADILNLFFSSKLTSWDVDFCIGRYPVRLHPLSNRIIMAETWHNPDWNYDRLVKNLSELLSARISGSGSWVTIAVRIAVLFGIFGERDIVGSGAVDIAAVTGDFTVPLSAWYARKMGLPIGNIVCCCNENKDVWDLICLGQMRTDGVCVSTIVPEADCALPSELERFISACGSVEDAEKYADICRTGGMYSPGEELLGKLRSGMYVSVISSSRIEVTIPNVYHTHAYLLTPSSALAYAGLMDYRAKTGIARTALVISDESPICRTDSVAKAMGMTVDELKRFL